MFNSSYPHQYTALENSMDRGAWRATVHGIAEWDTTEWLSLLLSLFLCGPFLKSLLNFYSVASVLWCFWGRGVCPKVHLVKAIYGFSSGHGWMWELDCEESWALENWCFWSVVLEKTLESPLDCKENQPVHPKGDQSWVFIGRTEVEAETPILWPPHVKSWLIGKDPDAGRDWGQEEKGMTGDEMAGWHHWLDGHEFG